MVEMMKIKQYLLFRLCWVAMVVVAAVSCTKNGAEPETNNPDPGPASGAYKFSIAAGYPEANSEEVTTRATLNLSNNIYYWDPSDRVGLFIAETGSSPILSNIPLDGTHTGPVAHTIFDGSLSPVQIGAMSSAKKYDYYSYYPYNASIGTFPNILFQTPTAITVSLNTFKPANMDIPMVAVPKTNQPPVIYRDGGGVTHTQLLHFDYKHLMSYAAIEMDCNLLPTTERVTSITITNKSGTQLSGTYNYNMLSGAGGYAGGRDSITITITGGLTVGGGDIIYIPMPPVNMSGQTLTFKFNTGGAAYSYISKDITGINFEQGKIHRLRIAPAAKYEGTTSFTTTIAGYYYIEAWGGNGGAGNGGRPGGSSQKIEGLYYFSAGSTVDLYVGTAGAGNLGTGGGAPQPLGGTNGSSYGAGGNGGTGGTGGGGAG